MSARPGSPEGEDTLHLILAELRSINAKLGQAVTVNPAVEHLTANYDNMLIGPEALTEIIEEQLHPGRGVIV